MPDILEYPVSKQGFNTIEVVMTPVRNGRRTVERYIIDASFVGGKIIFTGGGGSGGGGSYDPTNVSISGGAISGVRFTKRIVSVGYSATITPNGDTTDYLKIGALTGNLTIATPSGTPTDGQTMRVELLQDGTGSRTLTLGAGFIFPTSSTLSSPISESHFTAANALTILALQYSATRSKWIVVSFVPGY